MGMFGKNPKLSGTTHNVFGIQVGVGITVAVRKGVQRPALMSYYRVPEDWRKEEKLAFLQKSRSVGAVEWRGLYPSETDGWVIIKKAWETSLFLPLGTKAAKAGSHGQCISVRGLFSGAISQGQSYVINLNGAGRHRGLVQSEIVVTGPPPTHTSAFNSRTCTPCRASVLICREVLGGNFKPQKMGSQDGYDSVARLFHLAALVAKSTSQSTGSFSP